MAVRFTLTMNTSITDGATMRAECTQIAEMLERVAQKVQSTHQATGTMNDRNGLGTVTWTYTPTAAA
jgi:hypothetical protein